jgi:hypothetical protein
LASSREEANRAAADLWALRELLDRDPRLTFDDASAAELFEQLGAAIGEVYDRESEAIRLLASIPL